MTDAYHAASALEAEAALLALAKELDHTHPEAAASLREGLEDTLTVLRLGVPPTLARTLRSTNTIESMISVCREHSANVKRWRDGQMALRWCAAGMVEAGQTIPTCQRPPAPTGTSRRTRARSHQRCHTRRAQ
jgi:putative transposase